MVEMEGFPEELVVPEFPGHLLSHLCLLQEKGLLCDVRLTAKEGGVAAHRVVLMAASPHLQSRLSSGLTTEMAKVHFDDTPLVFLETVVRYLYTGKLVVCKYDVEQLKDFCETLGLNHAVDACKNYITQMTSIPEQKSDVNEAKEEVDSKDNLKEIITVNENNVIVSGIKKEVSSPKASRKGRRTRLTPRKRTSIAVNSDNVRLTVDEATNIIAAPGKKRRGRKPGLKLDKTKTNVKLRKKKKLEIKLDKCDTDKESKRRKLKDDSVAITGVTEVSSKQDGVDYGSDTDGAESIGENKTKVEADKDWSIPKDKKPVKKRIWKRRMRQKYPCSACAKVLSNQKRLVFHEFSKHDIPFDKSKYAMFPCKKEGCTYVAANRHNLDTHMKSRHGVVRPHICEFCGKAFKLPNVLATHLNIHTGSKVFHCEKCGTKFNQQSGLDVHVKRHHAGESTWVEMCHICSEKFLQKSDLAWHLFKAHDQPLPDRYKAHICEICSYQTKSVQDLERHMNAHKGIKQHPCPLCQKNCSTKSELKRHVSFHGEKSFKCTFDGCSFACTDAIGLGKHVRYMHTHRNYKPYVCPVCHYKTGVKGNQDKHIRTVHNLIVVAKHTVPLKMKYKNFQSGDVITKDGRLIATAIERKQLMNQELIPDDDSPDTSIKSQIKNSPNKTLSRKKKKFDIYEEPGDLYHQQHEAISPTHSRLPTTFSSLQTSPVSQPQPGISGDRQFTILDNYMHAQALRLPLQLDDSQSDVQAEDLRSQIPPRLQDMRPHTAPQANDPQSRDPQHTAPQPNDPRSRDPQHTGDMRPSLVLPSEMCHMGPPGYLANKFAEYTEIA